MWLSLALTCFASSARPPNLLLVVMDDINNEYVGAYQEGPSDKQPPTPNLDRLALEGVRFTEAYSAPVCSASRAALVTGRHGFRTGISNIILLGERTRLSLDEVTFAAALQPAGYFCSWIGKWHLGWDHPLDVLEHGWNEFIGVRGNVGDYGRYIETQAIEGGYFGMGLKTKYAMSRKANQAILRVTTLPEPWCVVLSLNSVHKPIHTPPQHLHSYGHPGGKQEKFEAMIQAMDTELGRVFDAVDLDDTVVMAWGDNGVRDEFSEDAHAKGKVTEAGINVPFIAAGPGIPRGRTSRSLVHLVDVFATVRELAGLPPHPAAEDSVSFAPVLSQPDVVSRSYIYTERRNHVVQPYGVDQQMVRGARYKLVRDHGRSREEMYDLQTAPPGTDGLALCWDCPSGLTDDQRRAYEALSGVLDRYRFAAGWGWAP